MNKTKTNKNIKAPAVPTASIKERVETYKNYVYITYIILNTQLLNFLEKYI